MSLCSDFLSIFESEPHIVFSVDGYKIHQSAPEDGIESVHQFSLCQGFEESLNLCPAGLLAADGFIQGFVPSLGGVEPFCQPIVAFLAFHLVEGYMSVFVDALLDEVGNHRHFAFQFSLFRFKGGNVEGDVEGCGKRRNDGILLRYQLIDR